MMEPMHHAFTIPEELRTDEFVLRPIQPSDAELDYAAVMESREFLHLWEQSTWPEDDFTVEDNRGDLVKHARRRSEGAEFTYTVVDPTGEECLGCVYVVPTASTQFSRSVITALGDEEWTSYQVATYFWIRQSRLSGNMEDRLIARLRTWFDDDWHIDRHLFLVSNLYEDQKARIETFGLTPRFTVQNRNTTSYYLAYGDSPLTR